MQGLRQMQAGIPLAGIWSTQKTATFTGAAISAGKEKAWQGCPPACSLWHYSVLESKAAPAQGTTLSTDRPRHTQTASLRINQPLGIKQPYLDC